MLVFIIFGVEVMLKSVVLATALVVAFGGAALAQEGGCTASVGRVLGSVLVNQGHGFMQVTPHIILHSGDIVMASGDGSGVVTFSDGTSANVIAGHAVRVPGGLPCSGTAGGGETANGFAPGYVLGGVAVLAGGGLIGLALSNSGKSSPVSP